ncbi:MAG: Hsp20/alpha crystallin family protein [Campylobacterales bacterium]|nr:Hsp20/alpha crystallin family protein [Campylobacterales bacterium]
MKPTTLLLTTLFSLPLCADLSLDMEQNMYAPAREMIQMDEAMNKAMDQHNQKEQMVEIIDETGAGFETNSMADLQDTGDGYRLEQTFTEPENTTVEVKIEGDMLKISTLKITTIKVNDLDLNTTTTSEEMQTIPYDADKQSMQQYYADGLLTVTFAKKAK